MPGNSNSATQSSVPHKVQCHTEWRRTQLSCKGSNSTMGSSLYPAARCLSWASWPCWDPAWENYNMPTRIWTPLVFKVMSIHFADEKGKERGERHTRDTEGPWQTIPSHCTCPVSSTPTMLLSWFLQHICCPRNPATAISPVGPDTSQLFSSPKDKAEEDCLKMTNRIILALCRAAVGASTAIYKGCGLQKANISPWPTGSLL